MDASQHIRKQLAENIILLHSLNEVPGKEKECDLPAENQSRQLSIAREKQLGDDFAFLSATTDDMSRVMAVGIEEDEDGTGMTIRLASNSGDLSSIRGEFERIGNILQEAASRTSARTDIRPRLLEQIIVMDEARILSRLRSRHAKRSRKTQGKRPLITLLDREINDPSRVPIINGTTVQLSEIRSRVMELRGMFERLELHPAEAAGLKSHHKIMMEIVKKAHEVTHQFDLGAILRSSITCNPSLAMALPKSLGKVGRYYSVSGALIDAARNPNYRVFNHIKVEILDPPTISWGFISQQSLLFDNALQRISKISTRSKNLTRAKQLSQPKIIESHLSQQRSFIHDPETASCSGIVSASSHFQQEVTVKSNAKELERLTQVAEMLGDADATTTGFIEEHKRLQEPVVSAAAIGTGSQSNQQQDFAQDLNYSPSRSLTSISTGGSQRTLRPAKTPSSSLHLPHTPMIADRTDDCMPNGSSDIVKEQRSAFSALTRDTWNCFKFMPPDYSITLRTDTIHLHLVRESEADMENGTQTEPSRNCWVGVKWVRLCNNSNPPHETSRHLDLNLLGIDDEVVEAGSDVHAKPLCLRKRNNLLAIKFAFDDPPPEPNIII
ncbi:hypothetical protein MMC32_002482 [Xylographa parallela]|nr:hypothetical protein [Xylographa parallela]